MKLALRLLWLSFCLAAAARAQDVPFVPGFAVGNVGKPHDEFLLSTPLGSSLPIRVEPSAPPRLGPAIALQAFERRSTLQAGRLASYSATVVIVAQLPGISQHGEFELEKRYSAPRTLVFKAMHFTGDSFVKHNVIVRLLASEVEHLRKDDPALTAISSANYKFSYGSTTQLEGRTIYAYQLKPRHKRSGLFKGRIYLNAYSGSLVREEGRLVKTSSFFVRNIDFEQDFTDIDSFTLPVHVHSEAEARFVGHAIVDIYQGDYEPVAMGLSPEDRAVSLFDCDRPQSSREQP